MNGQMRILRIFIQLLNGETLYKKDLIEEYQKKGSTIQRDMTVIEEALEENLRTSLNTPYIGRLFREGKGVYQLPEYIKKNFLTDDELLATLKILFASRAFNIEEMTNFIDKFHDLSKDKKRVRQFIANEELYYHGVSKVTLLDRINLIYDAISENKMIEFEYTKCGETRTFKRIPNAVHFSDLYFFMLSASHTAQDDGDFSALNKFRINNMVNPRIVSSKNRTKHKDRFESGALRNQTAHLPFLGNTITMIVDFYHDPVYVLDRFPNSKILKENEDGSFRIEVESNDGYGVKMWLLSQGDMIKVISPNHMREYIIQDMIGALDYYGYEVTPKEDS
ncbi:hypothetical protein BAU15_11800 [Enterococcus sp. JM4C]|uniref:helix-turn-helix transcriptional regulator n=1 Tax=Candidatus Enterococcus huntleyi TaxID=1857217 RepID=UPI00137A3452|nr:WYL domain-containing protein [Enterococcus sp. JM4C]KAF1298435.1 hypothetical protein BAU15_11800 [Enterococcus sp. JM4C]